MTHKTKDPGRVSWGVDSAEPAKLVSLAPETLNPKPSFLHLNTIFMFTDFLSNSV